MCFVTAAGGVLLSSALGTCSCSGPIAGGLQQDPGGPSCHGICFVIAWWGELRLNATKPGFNHTTGGHRVGVFLTAVVRLPWLGVAMGERRLTLDTIRGANPNQHGCVFVGGSVPPRSGALSWAAAGSSLRCCGEEQPGSMKERRAVLTGCWAGSGAR